MSNEIKVGDIISFRRDGRIASSKVEEVAIVGNNSKEYYVWICAPIDDNLTGVALEERMEWRVPIRQKDLYIEVDVDVLNVI